MCVYVQPTDMYGCIYMYIHVTIIKEEIINLKGKNGTCEELEKGEEGVGVMKMQGSCMKFTQTERNIFACSEKKLRHKHTWE